jgi:hypothetical protein
MGPRGKHGLFSIPVLSRIALRLGRLSRAGARNLQRIAGGKSCFELAIKATSFFLFSRVLAHDRFASDAADFFPQNVCKQRPLGRNVAWNSHRRVGPDQAFEVYSFCVAVMVRNPASAGASTPSSADAKCTAYTGYENLGAPGTM